MTTKDKEIFYEKLKERPMYNVELYDENVKDFKSFPSYAVADIDQIVNEMADEYSVWRSCEEDYLKAVDQAVKMESEAKQWKETALAYKEELERYRLVIKTIEFVSGRELDI